MEKIKPALGWL